jgi:dolichol-phosphate mannosyltransferase
MLEPVTSETSRRAERLAVVIPCYRVSRQIGDVLGAIGPEIWRIYCVDDACPEQSGRVVEQRAAVDPRVKLLVHERNRGVGAAVVTGYRQALDDGAEIIVKLDGDGQMDPTRICELTAPLRDGEADYVKGNRFYHLESLRAMPVARLIGNAGLSFLSKLSTGYWNLFDPTNGYTAIHAAVVRRLPLGKLHPRYFFESDILFRLNTLRAVVTEVPMDARYGEEKSSLSLMKAFVQFPIYHARNCTKRIFYNYFLRGFSVASINLVVGFALLLFGLIFGVTEWIAAAQRQVPASSGTVMLAALPVIIGSQLLLSFLSFDMANVPREPLHPRIRLREQRP